MELNEQKDRKKEMKPKSVVFGLLILLFGVVLLLRNTGLIQERAFHIIFSWEMLLIAIGLINLFDRNRPLGIILIAVGVLFLVPHVFNVPFSFHKIIWPAVIIIIGLFLIFGQSLKCRKKRFQQSSSGDDYIDEVAVFSGMERFIVTPNFKGGKIVTVFGGSKLNLMQAGLSPETNEIEIVCLFGGVTLLVPPDWNVKVEVMHVFGGFADKRNYTQIDYNKSLVIKGVTVFGGGEIKSF